MDQSIRFWDKIADRYSKRPIADEATYEKKLQVTRAYFRPDMEVLEFGCGTGSTAILHAPFVKHIEAIDISAKMIGFARTSAREQKIENVCFTQSSIEEFTAPDQSMHAVLGLNILHLVDNKEKVIARVHDVLRPGGVFISSTSCIGDTMAMFKYVAPLGRFLRLIPLLNVFKSEELVNSLTNTGFDIDHRWSPGKGRALFIVAKKRT